MIKKGCIVFLNKKREKLDWDNNDFSELEVVSEQPKMTDSAVADIPVDDDTKEDLGCAKEVKERPSYAMRTFAARQRAGLDVKPEPRQTRGVEGAR